MDEITRALAAQHAEFAGLLCGLDAAGWQRESRCPGWSVGEVVLHMAQTEELASASVRGQLPEALAAAGWADFDPGDIAFALGVRLEPTERLWHVARLAWRTLPYALNRAGQVLVAGVTLELTAPDGNTWEFTDESTRSLTTIRGSAETFCLVAARRIAGDESGLEATGPDRYAVLDLVRTFA